MVFFPGSRRRFMDEQPFNHAQEGARFPCSSSVAAIAAEDWPYRSGTWGGWFIALIAEE